MQDPYKPTAMPTPPNIATPDCLMRICGPQPERLCATFSAAREAACSDPVLGRLWLSLFDDGDV